MNLGFFLYIGNSCDQVESKIESIKHAIGVKNHKQHHVIRPSPNSLIVLSHCKDLKENEIFYQSDQSLFFYGGAAFPENSSDCIPGTPFIRPEVFLQQVNNLDFISQSKVEPGNFGACSLLFNKKDHSVNLKFWTDVMGLYPIYYSHSKNGLIVSNFAEAIIASRINKHQLQKEMVVGFLTTGVLLPDECFVDNIHQLAGNSSLKFSFPENRIKKVSGESKWNNSVQETSVKELAEVLYHQLRKSIKIRSKNYIDPITLKLSGGMDSRYLLHHFLEEKIPLETVTYRYNNQDEFDSILPQKLANHFKFKHEVVDTPFKVTDFKLEDTILGVGRSSSVIRKGVFSGTFAGVSAKCLTYMTYEKNVQKAREFWKKTNIFKNDFIEDVVQKYTTSIDKTEGVDPAHRHRRWSLRVNSTSFINWVKDIELCRPGFFFRGTRHMPFTDSAILEMANRYPADLEPLDLYGYAFDHWMKEMKIVPMETHTDANAQMSYTKEEDTMIYQHHCNRLQEMFKENPVFGSWFEGISPETMPFRFRTFLYNFGAWQSRFFQVT